MNAKERYKNLASIIMPNLEKYGSKKQLDSDAKMLKFKLDVELEIAAHVAQNRDSTYLLFRAITLEKTEEKAVLEEKIRLDKIQSDKIKKTRFVP